MDKVLERYSQGKFQECLELIKLLPKTEDLVSNLLKENNSLICELLIRINKNDCDQMHEAQEKLYLFFEKVTSLSMVINSIPFELKVTATFNFIFWLLFYNDNGISSLEKEEYLKLVFKGLHRVAGNNSLKDNSNTADKIFNKLCRLKSVISDGNIETGILVTEFVLVVLLYILKLDKCFINKCFNVISSFLDNLDKTLTSVKSVSNFLNEKPVTLCLFKFGLVKLASFIDTDFKKIDYLWLLKSALLYLTGDYKGSLLSLQKSTCSNVSMLWNYLGALNSYKLENWNLCLSFLSRGTRLGAEGCFKGRYYIMYGKLNTMKNNHKEALKCYQNALNVFPSCHLCFYYMGQEYGKMGLYDLMVNSYERLIEVLKYSESEDLKHNFGDLILNWIHPYNEVTKLSALYSLAVSYGLNERYHKAAETFEKIIQELGDNEVETTKGIIQMPTFLTILHDTSTMHMLSGNLVRSEQLALEAAECYVPETNKKNCYTNNCLLTKDVDWLQNVIQVELLERDSGLNELSNNISYSEDLIFGFSQNLVALLILSEIQGIQEVEDHKITLSKILSIFSTYLSSMLQKEMVGDNEKCVWTLVKALASKTCVKIAAQLLKLEDELNVERMYKRALSCNKGDKDALYSYYTFLIKKGKNRDAFKLWHTFCKEETSVSVDKVQSFALKYFLANKVTKQELEKIQSQVDLMSNNFH